MTDLTGPGPGDPSPTGASDLHDLPLHAYEVMALVLRIGLVIAVGFLVLGTVLFFARHPSASILDVFQSATLVHYLTDPVAFGTALAGVRSTALLTLGVLFLVGTPVARVFTGWLYFVEEKEVEMAAVTLTVMTMLLLGLFVVGPLIARL